MSHGPASATANDRDELGTDECMRRLAAAHVGHLGFTAKALPVVTPIRYLLCGQAIVFATGSATELRSAHNHAVACVGISGVDQSTGAEWTVLATGRLRGADDSATSAGAQALPPAWGAPDAKRFIALDIELLNGCATRLQ
jgi:nitroimidazol reductase NimA-like FMN-containing flavoprotein (pyridoxamine 5'-phosphate oxidase superfamily)